jgi:OmpA-OmpF porin, OOP family
MSTNLLDSLKGYITPEIVSQASSMLGESEGGISKAITAVIPTLLGGLVHKSGDSGVMGSVMDLVTKSTSDSGGVMSNLTGLLSGGSDSSSVGSSFLNLIFGGKLGGITDMIAGTSGIKSSSVSSLLGMAGPMLLGHIGSTGTSLSGLTSMLSSQKDSILAAAPAGLASLSGLTSGIGGSSSSNTGGSGGGLPKWLLPLLLIAAVLFGLYYFTRGCKKTDTNMDPAIKAVDSLTVETVDTLTTNIDSLATGAKEIAGGVTAALGNLLKFKLPNGVELNAPEKGIEGQIVTWMNDKTKIVDKTTWFNFDRLLFETGKSTLQAESQEQLKNIAEIMKAFPTMEIKLGGYTDNVGKPESNLKLSGERANTVMQEIVKLGIDAKRINSEGYGDQHPVASNDTEEGRAQNRRIAVRISKK